MKTQASFLSLGAALSALVLSLTTGSAFAARPDGIRGVPNFHAVNEQVYRGGQPSEEGFRSLAKAGVKTIVDLQEEGERAKEEKRLVRELGMKYVNIPMRGMHTPKDKSVSHALRVLKD